MWLLQIYKVKQVDNLLLFSSQIYNILFINVFDILFLSWIYLIARNITVIIWIVFVTSRRKMLTFVNDLW